MPLEIDKHGNREWLNSKGQYHRIDGPAIEYINGSKEWWMNGIRHRKFITKEEFNDIKNRQTK